MGAFTFAKIWAIEQKDSRQFGLIISGLIAGYGASIVAGLLSYYIWNTVCDGHYTYGNIRAYGFFLAIAVLCRAYKLIFSVSYLETGLKMVFLQSDAYIWARQFFYFSYLPLLAYSLGVYFTYMDTPVFRPGDVTN